MTSSLDADDDGVPCESIGEPTNGSANDTPANETTEEEPTNETEQPPADEPTNETTEEQPPC